MVRRLVASALVVTACVVTACSLIVNDDAYQCRTTADCAKLNRPGCHGGGLVCGDDHICARNAIYTCCSNVDCIDAFKGEPYICRKTDFKCIHLGSQDCSRVIGADAVRDDNVVILGAVCDLTTDAGPNACVGVELAANEITAQGGLPPLTPGGPRRPLAIVECDSHGQTAPIHSGLLDVDNALKHLLYDLRSPVVLGTTSSALDLALVPPLASQDGTLFLGHTADSALLDGLTVATDAGARLYYRTSASERQPLALLVQSITDYFEPALRAPGGPLAGGGEMNVLAVLRSDPSSGARGLLGQMLHVRYASVAYADVSEGVEAVLTAKPHVLILDGGDEIYRELIPRLEAGWTEAAYRPRILIAGGRGKTALFAAAIGHDEDRRTFGFTAGPLGQTRPGLGDVVAAQGYDATWVAYYALALRDRAGNAAWSLEKLLPAPGRPTVELGPTSLASGLALLDVGFDLRGATGPLDFDPATGTPEQDVDMWYLGADGSFVSTGYQYSATQKRIIGTPVVR